MSTFINTQKQDFRWRLLSTVSATTLLVSAYGAQAADADRPLLWIELGGQLSQLSDGQETFAPHLMADRPSILSPSQKFERPPRYSLDEGGKISFQPDGSDWLFSASVRYGRSSSNRHVHQQTTPKTFVKYSYYYVSGVRHKHTQIVKPDAGKFADTNAQTGERHFIVDFQAGKDVGLGMLGINGGSSINLGVRFAQFENRSNIALRSDPDWKFNYKYFGTKKIVFPSHEAVFHSNAASFNAERSFHGIGPSLSWNASAGIAGNPQNGELDIDWGVNAALLFGRQRAKVHHQTTGRYHRGKYANGRLVTNYQPTPVSVHRTKSVIVPNIGGFAGLSFRYSDAKLSLGYRADFFSNAMDGGIDVHKSENRGFYGPFASISVGLGD